MAFVLTGLDPEKFQAAFLHTDGELQARGMRRVRADQENAYPCRVSLEDAAPGEELLLLPFVHQPTDSPYRASGPIFVRKAASHAARIVGEIPGYLSRRILSVRAYNSRDEIIDADVSPGSAAQDTIRRLLDNTATSYLHVHFARHGCFACRVDRH